MKRSRVSYLLVCYNYPPVLGGSEMEAQRVSTELQNRGHWVKVVCSGGSPMPPVSDWVDPFGVRVKLLAGRWPSWLRGYLFALGVPRILFLERHHFEIAYFLMQGLHVATGVLMAKFLGKKIVMKFSGSGQVVQMQDSWVGRLELALLRRWASSILILNPGMEDEAREVGFAPARIGWMPNPINTDQFSPCSRQQKLQLRRELGIGPDTPLVVYVGRLDNQKNVPWLVTAFARVSREEPGARLALLGDGPLQQDLERLVAGLGLGDRVIFTGRQSAEGVVQWLRAADVYTLVSLAEGLPCSLIEAMAVGLPAVVSRIPAHTQIVDHGIHGLITELGDEDSVAQALLRLLRDEDLRNRLGAASRLRVVEQYATPQVGDRYEQLFAAVLAAD